MNITLEIEFLRRRHMHRPFLLIPSLVFLSVPAFGQSAATDSQTLQALLTEVRQLHRDLQTTTVAAQRAQVLVYRLQAQESAVRRMQERVDDARSKLAQIHSEEKRLTATLKQYEDSASHTDNPAQEKEIADVIAHLKAGLETQTNNEQEAQAKLTEGEEQLRIEQAKLAGLEDHLDRLEKTLESLNQPAGGNPH
jgi:chromosome segregation ATPase